MVQSWPAADGGPRDVHPGARVAVTARVLDSPYVVYLFTFVICVLVSAASYPGFMSFDSFESLRQAREQVEGGPYPPFGAYVWRVFDAIWPGPTLMQFAQNGLLLFSFATIVRKLRIHAVFQLVAIATFALLPPLLGIMLVVWKDVAVAACLMGALALLLVYGDSAAPRRPAYAAAFALLFAGMAYRYNAASAVLPLLVYLAFTLIRRGSETTRVAKALVAGTGLTFLLFGMVSFFNSHRFPGLEKLRSNENMANIQNYDLIGISAHAPVSVVPDASGKGFVSREYLRKIYDPVHLNKTMDNDRQRLLHPSPGVSGRWIDAIKQHPMAYIQHRSDMFGEFLDFHQRPVFYPTHPFVDANKFGITYTPTRLSNATVDYVNRAATGWISRPWIYLAMGLLLLVAMYALRVRPLRKEALVVYSSGILYLLPMYFISPAADLRYNFWSICASLLASLFAIVSISRFAWRRAGPSSMSVV